MRVLDVSRKSVSEFTQEDWQLMGKHHAQALFARCWEGTHYRLQPGHNTLFLECVQEAARHELHRAEGLEKDYWRTFVITLNLCALFFESRWGLFVVAENGKTIASAKTGSWLVA